jgi:hypothetical protein
MTDPSAVLKTYLIRTVLFMGGYTAINVAAITGAFDDMRSPGTWGFALSVAAPVIGHIWAALAFMRDSDEFVRSLMAKRFIIASGVAMALFCAWGFMETYARAPHVPGWMLFPVFWAAFGVVSPFVRTTH